MSPQVFAIFEDIVKKHLGDRKVAAVMEAGASAYTLLSMDAFDGARKIALNLGFEKTSPELEQCEMVLGNSNELEYSENTFDCILSSSSLEHDKYFWRSTGEFLRVLKPGGLAIIGVPIYMTLPDDSDNTTRTFARHGIRYNADFYRFSPQCLEEVFFEDYSEVVEKVIVRTHPNPYAVYAGRK
ncbi:methyltransferase domain-containing protein [Rhizobium ruizarguesonis]|nr:methyltransferase domain-containing protein [Rhizobium ruizarguesonis]TBB65107.1 methyltransferase domain-containing protein [Rhizobium ruizarguesonis]